MLLSEGQTARKGYFEVEVTAGDLRSLLNIGFFKTGLDHNDVAGQTDSWVLGLKLKSIYIPENVDGDGDGHGIDFDGPKPKSGDKIGALVDLDAEDVSTAGGKESFWLQFCLNRERYGPAVFSAVAGPMLFGAEMQQCASNDAQVALLPDAQAPSDSDAAATAAAAAAATT
jgi:hypothetical protein